MTQRNSIHQNNISDQCYTECQYAEYRFDECRGVIYSVTFQVKVRSLPFECDMVGQARYIEVKLGLAENACQMANTLAYFSNEVEKFFYIYST